ncbi:PIN domain-containing protein [Ramlibacter sp.]|uniref:PIN domain-containing protein n=1 Tax=Ramlibacter sp. TaxID=1917967 RepID=UPI002D4CD099|nr:PIN domain-containing protein [Ramlibacter sp.]HYD75076.1 PIN domain-containing protein [Ramlibacter sp.]
MRPNVVLVDFESVQPASLGLLTPEHFRVMVFVGATQTKLSFELVAAVQQLGNRAEYIKISGIGRNALDFHIAYYIGRIATEQPDVFFHIISKDTGFDPLIQHLKEKNIFCGRWESVEEIPAVKASQVKSPEERAILFMSRLLQPKATKPRTEKTLRSAISAHFHRQLSEEEISAIVDALRRPGHISIADGKVLYASAG